MHIAHLVTRLLRAGSEENTLATCRWLVEAGHRVTLIHGDTHDPFWDQNMPQGVDRIAVPEMVHPVRPVQDVRAITRLRALYREIAPDVIHTHQSKAGILGRIAARAVPEAVVAHGIHIVPFEGVSPAKRALFIAAEKLVARQTDVFIGVSEAGVTGRGPTRLISPRSTFQIWGSSSNELRRRNRPNRVTRGSFCSFWVRFHSVAAMGFAAKTALNRVSASGIIVRIFQQVNVLPA
jgi:hypothetical protein